MATALIQGYIGPDHKVLSIPNKGRSIAAATLPYDTQRGTRFGGCPFVCARRNQHPLARASSPKRRPAIGL